MSCLPTKEEPKLAQLPLTCSWLATCRVLWERDEEGRFRCTNCGHQPRGSSTQGHGGFRSELSTDTVMLCVVDLNFCELLIFVHFKFVSMNCCPLEFLSYFEMFNPGFAGAVWVHRGSTERSNKQHRSLETKFYWVDRIEACTQDGTVLLPRGNLIGLVPLFDVSEICDTHVTKKGVTNALHFLQYLSMPERRFDQKRICEIGTSVWSPYSLVLGRSVAAWPLVTLFPLGTHFFRSLQTVEQISEDTSSIQVSDVELLDATATSTRIQLEFVTGTMLRERVPGFMRLLWCACRGNAFFKFAEMPEEVEDINTVSFVDFQFHFFVALC